MFSPQLGILGQLTAISLLASLLQRCAATAPSFPTAYCSTLNTGADNISNMSIYQSQGLCSTFCSANWAFGVLQGKVCWCTDFAPGVSTSSSDCADSCPGFLSDTCGNSAENLFEYIALNLAASGTQGASSSSTPSSAAATSSSPPPAPVTVTATPPPPVTVTETPPSPTPQSTSIPSSSPLPIVVTPSSTAATTPDDSSTTTAAPSSTIASTTSSSKEATTATSSSSSTWIPVPVTSVETVTNGHVMTVTITPTSPPGSAATDSLTADQHSGGGSSLSGGQAAGLTIGLIAFIAIVAGITYFCWRKRKHHQNEISEYGGISRQGSTLVSGGGPQPPSRTMSENSRYVLSTDGRAVYPAWENDENNQGGSRSSRLVPIDPRLDPYAGIYQHGGAPRGSHDSVNTISDGRDYSRRVANTQAPVLRALNPDPETPR